MLICTEILMKIHTLLWIIETGQKTQENSQNEKSRGFRLMFTNSIKKP
jgi:hypothetical protein